MPVSPFEVIWERIKAHAGPEFKFLTIQQEEFWYTVSGNIFRPSRTKYKIHRSEFEKAYPRVPFSGPGEITQTIRGSSYVWGVLHDEKISKGEW